MAKKQKVGSHENVRVDKTIKDEVKAYCDNNGLKLGKFYDIAVKEKMNRDTKK